ncbi:MAG: hypothetical protein UY50_C0008G0018 [Parcubacteria group bacterium GW2011_GWA2_49_9]|nr:MAG: hypothetical protein UY50_C0008G0018 [Parcubacteria group bacterium GW2011_GWA2_49_9]
MIILYPYIKGLAKDIKRLNNIEGWRLREFARNQLQFIAFRPTPTDLLDFLNLMSGQSSVLLEERGEGRESDCFPRIDEMRMGLRREFFSVVAENPSSHLIALSTPLPKKDGVGPSRVIDVITVLKQAKSCSTIRCVARHCVVDIGSVVEISVDSTSEFLL